MKKILLITFTVVLNFTLFAQSADSVCSTAASLIGTKYLAGGMSPSGFDCSGFTNYVFKKNNILLARTSTAQSQSVKLVKAKKAKPGDLLFFGKSKKKIHHVGIVVENKKGILKMIHSSSSKGVILTDVSSSAYWSKRLQKAGRVL